MYLPVECTCPGGCTWLQGAYLPRGVLASGVYLPRGDVPARGVPARGVPAQGGACLGGCTCPGECTWPGGWGYLPRYSPLWTDRHVSKHNLHKLHLQAVTKHMKCNYEWKQERNNWIFPKWPSLNSANSVNHDQIWEQYGYRDILHLMKVTFLDIVV